MTHSEIKTVTDAETVIAAEQEDRSFWYIENQGTQNLRFDKTGVGRANGAGGAILAPGQSQSFHSGHPAVKKKIEVWLDSGSGTGAFLIETM